jgi:NDP-sugar pyrophosphorylase family protein
MVNASYQAVVLAGGEDQILYPLTTTTVKALLPVANKPLISYPLRTLAEAGLQRAIVVRWARGSVVVGRGRPGGRAGPLLAVIVERGLRRRHATDLAIESLIPAGAIPSN